MPATYKKLYGADWPAGMSDEFIGLVIGKKWRFLKERGIEIKDPWVPFLKSATMLFPSDIFKVSEWTEQHAHDFVMYDRLVTWGCASSSKSNDTGAFLVLDWVVDPFDTVSLLGSTTKQDLKSRSWEAVVRYHQALASSRKFTVPGRISKQGQALINIGDDEIQGSNGEKAGIQGRALNEDGRLQGAHAKYVRLVVDELAEINDHESIKKAAINLAVGALSFKFIGLANPASWDNASCQYCIPEKGISSVTVDTGSWMSKSGFFVRHHDGLKSPCVLHPELAKDLPFLLNRTTVDTIVHDLAGGNMDSPQVWQMLRGFPTPLGTEIPTVLDPRVAREQLVSEKMPLGVQPYAAAAGIDPAWSQGGDGAIYQLVIVRTDGGRPILDFGGESSRLQISASSKDPVTKQLRDQTVALMRKPGYYSAPLGSTAVDASANQGLADDLDIYVGQGAVRCVHVNNSLRASDYPVRANDPTPARERYGDRGTESWCVLAEYCKAGMVRGLPAEALRALTSRRFAVRAGTTVQRFPLRLEDKDSFKLRFRKSPDEADACALAALAVKETLGILPFGWLPAAKAPLIDGSAPALANLGLPRVDAPDPEAYTAEDDAGGNSYSPDGGQEDPS